MDSKTLKNIGKNGHLLKEPKTKYFRHKGIRSKELQEEISVKKRIIAGVLGTLTVLAMSTTAAQAGSTCRDGWSSSSAGRGTCSYHGGIDRSYPSYSDRGFSSNNSWSNRNSYSYSSPSYSSNRSSRSNSGWDSWSW